MTTPKTPCARGRPRDFSREGALASALQVFWAKGYEGASLDDLTQALCISRPSLYAAVGNKEALFREVLDLYEREHLRYLTDAIEQPTARQVFEAMLLGAVNAACAGDQPHGCLRVINSVAAGDDAQPIRREILKGAGLVQAALTARLERAVMQGDLLPDVDPRALTVLLAALLQGISVQAAQCAAPEDLQRIADASLQLWGQPSARR